MSIELDELQKQVAPFAGAWIEIVLTPMIATEEDVAPFAGAWIEISQTFAYTMVVFVAPFAGAWIEISLVAPKSSIASSLPSRERGLKYIIF